MNHFFMILFKNYFTIKKIDGDFYFILKQTILGMSTALGRLGHMATDGI